MTPQPITVAPETSVVDIARVLLEHDISAVPVVDSASRVVGIVSEGDLMRRTEVATERQRPWWLALVGIVSRLDILRALIAARPRRESRLALSDGEIRDPLLQDLEKVGWATTAHINPIVSNGTVHLRGLVGSDEERHAMRVAAERFPGVPAVEDHLRRGSA